MINTVNTKAEQLTNTYFSIGTGKEVVLVMGSCRSVPYMNYFKKLNEENNRFTINFIDPFMWNWDMKDERTDYDVALSKLETDERLLNMLKSVGIFIHEYYQNAGMFNINKGDNKTIYDFGMKSDIDVCIPNFNDYFILFKDIISFDLEIRKKAIQDINVIGKLSEQTQVEIFNISRNNLRKFYDVCLKSDIPEMKEYFQDVFRIRRLFHTYNHVSKNFTMAIFNFVSDKWLRLNLLEDFYDDQEDIFASNFTPLTEYDLKFYNYEWDEETKSIL
jgi:hypothetical protein